MPFVDLGKFFVDLDMSFVDLGKFFVDLGKWVKCVWCEGGVGSLPGVPKIILGSNVKGSGSSCF